MCGVAREANFPVRGVTSGVRGERSVQLQGKDCWSREASFEGLATMQHQHRSSGSSRSSSQAAASNISASSTSSSNGGGGGSSGSDVRPLAAAVLMLPVIAVAAGSRGSSVHGRMALHTSGGTHWCAPCFGTNRK